MLAVGILALLAAEILADTADVIGALSLDALRGTDVAFDERIHQARPHPGQLKTAANLRKMLEGSGCASRISTADRVQDAYSLRCMPQVHGAVRDTLAHCREVMEIEVNSAVDNPLVFLKSVNVGADAHASRTGRPRPPSGAKLRRVGRRRHLRRQLSTASLWPSPWISLALP